MLRWLAQLELTYHRGLGAEGRATICVWLMDASVEDMEESGEAHGTTFNYKIYRILFLEAQVYYMDEYFVKDYRNHWRVLWNYMLKNYIIFVVENDNLFRIEL